MSSTEMNVSLVGVGGQGILLTSDILAKVAMASGCDVKKSEIHGMAQRGGSVISQVRFGAKVYSPIIPDGESQILVAFERTEALRWRQLAADDAQVLINDIDLTSITVSSGQQAAIENLSDELARVYPQAIRFNAQELALGLGNVRCMNMVIAGKLSLMTPFEEAAWLAVLHERIPAQHLDLNLKAFAAGRHA